MGLIDKFVLRYYRILFVAFLFCMAVPGHAKELSEKHHAQLVERVRHQYDMTGMQGTTAYKFKGKHILVAVVEVKKSPNAQRIAQVKASRSVGEYLQGALNKSVTVYEVVDSQSYSLSDSATDSGKSHNGEAESHISQLTSENQNTVTEERFSDKVIQSSMNQVKGVQPLCLISDDNRDVVYAFYIIM